MPREEVDLFFTNKGRWEVKIDGGRVVVDADQVPDGARKLQRETGQYKFDVDVFRTGPSIEHIVPRGWPLPEPEARPVGNVDDVFRNPYNFVPVEDRSGFTGPLADAAPVGHARYVADAWSGTIRVRATVRTPLIITPATAAHMATGDHPTYNCRVGPDGLPWLPPSTLRGALRSRYEAITDSRFGVVSEVLDRRFAFRLGTGDAQRAVPSIVAEHAGERKVVPLLGSSPANRGDQPLWAAWLPMRCTDADRLAHGTFVHARLRRYQHVNHRGGARYPIWYVERAVPAGQTLPADPWEPGGATGESVQRYEPDSQTMIVHGWIFRTSPAPDLPSTNTRKFERLFFVADTAAAGTTQQQVIARAVQRAGDLVAPFDGELRDGWEAVIRAYDDAIADRARGEHRNGSAHLPENGSAAHREARAGLLSYAILDPANRRIAHLSPVTIGREPYKHVARDLLPDSVDVARSWSELSPADRVFGWVHPEAGDSEDRRVALRSSLRVSPCTFDPPPDGQPPLIDADHPRTLAILSGPKPSYGRFYLTRADGTPPDGGHKREVGYAAGNRLRGRKVYPHQPQAETPHWFSPGGGKPWESTDPSNQNRTVRAWVRPGATFSFDIQVRNLSGAELGALLEVIGRASGSGRLRLGYARPLGFGSVQLELAEVCVETGAQRRQRLAAFDPTPPAPCPAEVRDELLRSFKQAFEQAHGSALDEHPIGWATSAEARGFDDGVVVAYPGVAEGRPSYEWFMDNENDQRRGNPGAQEALERLDIRDAYRNSRRV